MLSRVVQNMRYTNARERVNNIIKRAVPGIIVVYRHSVSVMHYNEIYALT